MSSSENQQQKLPVGRFHSGGGAPNLSKLDTKGQYFTGLSTEAVAVAGRAEQWPPSVRTNYAHPVPGRSSPTGQRWPATVGQPRKGMLTRCSLIPTPLSLVLQLIGSLHGTCHNSVTSLSDGLVWHVSRDSLPQNEETSAHNMHWYLRTRKKLRPVLIREFRRKVIFYEDERRVKNKKVKVSLNFSAASISCWKDTNFRSDMILKTLAYSEVPSVLCLFYEQVCR